MALSLEIDTKDAVCKNFVGFGAEWDSYNYPGIGVTDDEFALIRKRVEWMRLPTARIMMVCNWCYQGNDQYDWESAKMQALYRHLDVCQALGTTVFLTDWGCEAEWLKCPDVEEVVDPKYAEIIGVYMEYLLKEKGYTCIKHFIMGNEPNYEVESMHRWRTGVRNVYAALEKHGLTKDVIFTGSDQVDAEDWHQMAVDQLSEQLGAYDFHCYADGWLIDDNLLYEYCKRSWEYVREHDPNGADKPCVIGEAGLGEGANHPYGNANIDSVAYGLGMVDYAAQAANAGSAAVFAWMLDDNSHKGFYWGMWSNREKGLQLRPWFTAWSLLARHVPKGSQILRTTPLGTPGVQVLVARTPGEASEQGWTLCMVNRTPESQALRLTVAGASAVELDRYVYGGEADKKDEDGFPVAVDQQKLDLAAGVDLVCDAEQVVMLTSVE